MMEHYDILIIGGGAAGIAAAKEAAGAKVLLADSRSSLGGVLLQCTHLGFGKNKSGIQYAADLLLDFPKEITLALNTTVLSVSEDRTALLSGREFGRKTVAFSQLILATGCREIPMGALPIGGTRPEGVYTAGFAQELLNLHGITLEQTSKMVRRLEATDMVQQARVYSASASDDGQATIFIGITLVKVANTEEGF